MKKTIETMNRATGETMLRRCDAANLQAGLTPPVKNGKPLSASVPGAQRETPAVAARKPA